MSAVWRGARNGPGSPTAWTGSDVEVEAGSVGVVGVEELGPVAPVVDEPAVGSDPLPQEARSNVATTAAAHAIPGRPRAMVEG
jgi:hypothetical protein